MGYWDEKIEMVHSFSGERKTVQRRDEIMHEVMGYVTVETTLAGVLAAERASPAVTAAVVPPVSVEPVPAPTLATAPTPAPTPVAPSRVQRSHKKKVKVLSERLVHH